MRGRDGVVIQFCGIYSLYIPEGVRDDSSTPRYRTDGNSRLSAGRHLRRFRIGCDLGVLLSIGVHQY